MKTPGTSNFEREPSLAHSISNISDLNKGAEEILHHCLRELRAISGSIFFIDESKNSLQLVRAIGPRENLHCGETIRIGEGISGYVAARKEPLLVSNLSKRKELFKRKEHYPLDSFMSCPLLQGASVLGVINVVGRQENHPFSRRDLKKFQAISEGFTDSVSQMIAYRRSFSENQHLRTEIEKNSESLQNIEEQLQEIKRYNASILRCLSQYVLIFDPRLNITYCNKEDDFIRLFGLRKDVEIVKQSILDLPFDVERNKLKGKLESMLSVGAPFSLHSIRIKDCPELCIVNMFFAPFSSSRGVFLGGLLLVDDNTKNYEMEQRLLEAEKFSLIGSLTSMITHEVNSPLDGVMRLINLSLEQIEEDDSVKEYLNEAQKGLHRIASLVNSLLRFSRKSISLDAEFTPLNTVIDHGVKVVRNRNEDKDVSVHLSLASESLHVKTNDFYQVISNLLSNSFDAITSRGGNVRVETEVDRDSLHIFVEDDGCGIPKAVQNRMFQTFWSTKEYGKGTGLGLAIVKKVVDKYNGTIDVESAENVGTKMHLNFPLSKLTP